MLATHALSFWFDAGVLRFAGPVALHDFVGSQPNPIDRVLSDEAVSVLCRMPFGLLLLSTPAVKCEHLLLAATCLTFFPVSRPSLPCDDPEVFETPLYAMKLVDGEVHQNDAPLDRSRFVRAAIGNALVDTLDTSELRWPRALVLFPLAATVQGVSRRVVVKTRLARRYHSTRAGCCPSCKRRGTRTSRPSRHEKGQAS